MGDNGLPGLELNKSPECLKDRGMDFSRKKEEKEKQTRRDTIEEYWEKYRSFKDIYGKDIMRKQLRKLIREFRKYFPKE